MKQMNKCLDRFFAGKWPANTKWKAISHAGHPDQLFLFHYHHLVLHYDLKNDKVLYQWWEKPADLRGLKAALNYLEGRTKTNGSV